QVFALRSVAFAHAEAQDRDAAWETLRQAEQLATTIQDANEKGNALSNGKFLAQVPEQGNNPFCRPLFQNLQYSDTPTQPLVPMRYTDTKATAGKTHSYRVIAVNTVGAKSTPSTAAVTGSAHTEPKVHRGLAYS